MRRVARIALTGLAVVLAGAGLTGCRTSPNVAAYVGSEQISVTELQSALDSRRKDDDVAAFAKDNQTAFTRQVLSLLVGEEVYSAAAAHWDVTVSDSEVRSRIDTLLVGNDPNAVYAQLAAQGIGRQDVFENVRQQVLRQKIARAEGLDDALSTAALQKRYQQNRDQYKQYVFGYIAVPDQATADSVLSALTSAPDSYATLAAQHNDGITLLQPEARPVDQLPQALSQQIVATSPGTGFTLPVDGVGVVVAFVTDVTFQSFDDVRSDLQDAAQSEVDDAAQKAVQDFRAGLDVTVNPRYGVLKENAVVADDSGVVDILGGGTNTTDSAAATPSSTTGG